jgi:hypothetical protein
MNEEAREKEAPTAMNEGAPEAMNEEAREKEAPTAMAVKEGEGQEIEEESDDDAEDRRRHDSTA